MYLGFNALVGKIGRLYTHVISFLDAPVSNTAPANTALSNTVWTNVKAGYLDGYIKNGYPLETVTQKLTASGTWNRPSDMIGDLIYISGCAGGGGGGAHYNDSYEDHYGTGGSGGMSLVNMPYVLNGASSVNYAIGAGGVGGVSGGAGPTHGGNTIFGRIILFGGLKGAHQAYTYTEKGYKTFPPLRKIKDTGLAHGTLTAATSGITPVIDNSFFIDGGVGWHSKSRPSFDFQDSCPFTSNYTVRTIGQGGDTMYGVGGTSTTAAPDGYGGGGRAGQDSENGNGGPGKEGVLFVTYFRRVQS
jgi:hypothetical protein